MATATDNRPAGSGAFVSVADRAARGRAARRLVPRSSHAEFEPPADRRDPVELLELQARTRVPELVPIRYGRMLLSPFTFYRGGALLMAHDLSTTPRSGLDVQCCGDAHLSNFGVFASPERRLVFDINDFDETLPGPWEWDLKRLATSVLVAARDNEFAPKWQRQAVLETVGEYRLAMARFATMKNLEVYYTHLDIETLMRRRLGSQLQPKQVKRTQRAIAKARTRDSMSAFSKLAEAVNGTARIVADPPLIVPIDALAEGREREDLLTELHALMRSFLESLAPDRRLLLEQFELVDFGRKVVGVGSVGTRAWIALLLGHDESDPLFLQMKEAEPAVSEEFLAPSEYPNHGQRVVAGQRLMQAASDIFLGWVHVESGLDGRSRDFYGRQLKDWKGSAEIERMSPQSLGLYGRICAWTLARAHARSGDRVAIASYLGRGATFDRAIAEFARAYADQNERDFAALEQAAATGRITVERGL
jgi:uncharacterized protein (DUF2252 family)